MGGYWCWCSHAHNRCSHGMDTCPTYVGQINPSVTAALLGLLGLTAGGSSAGDNMGGLPPRPDPETGELRPPAAPVQHHGTAAEKAPSRLPDPPERQGPVMEYYRESKRCVWA